MKTNRTPKSSNKERRSQRPKEFVCHACGRKLPFCWWCPCGFMICWDCMEENFWGMTCNGVVWTCPDCGAVHGFGND